MSDMIEAKKIVVMRDYIVGKKCDVCGKEILPTAIPHKYEEPFYDYYEITTHHNDWGNDSIDSYEHFDACSPDCAFKLWEEYIHDSAGTWRLKCIEVEHVNCWTLEDAEVSDDD